MFYPPKIFLCSSIPLDLHDFVLEYLFVSFSTNLNSMALIRSYLVWLQRLSRNFWKTVSYSYCLIIKMLICFNGSWNIYARLFENIKIYLSSFHCMERTEFLHTLVILRYKALIHLKLNYIKMCFQRFKTIAPVLRPKSWFNSKNVFFGKMSKYRRYQIKPKETFCYTLWKRLNSINIILIYLGIF